MKSSGSVAVLMLLALAGCASPRPPDTLLPALQRYYARHAVEEGGACATPALASIAQRKVISTSADQTVLRVRYSYVDASVEDETDWDRVLLRDRKCAGMAERDFTLVRRKTGYAVTEMSGGRRGG
ncbi:MAG: hypothetical protein R3349_03825 [Geminicoccaceae bacterium]|nr:hypothetical protein [Geminicoccaceae bacterium]